MSIYTLYSQTLCNLGYRHAGHAADIWNKNMLNSVPGYIAGIQFARRTNKEIQKVNVTQLSPFFFLNKNPFKKSKKQFLPPPDCLSNIKALLEVIMLLFYLFHLSLYVSFLSSYLNSKALDI